MIFTSKAKKQKETQELKHEFNHKGTTVEESVKGATPKHLDVCVKSLILGASELCGDTRSKTAEFMLKAAHDPNMLLAMAMFLHHGIISYQRELAVHLVKEGEGKVTDEVYEDFKDSAEREFTWEIDFEHFAEQMIKMIDEEHKSKS